MDAPADDLRGGLGALFKFHIGIEDEIADPLLGRGVGDRTQEGKAPALAVDGVLTRGERDVATATAAALPDREPDQPESVERSADEVQFRVGELSGRAWPTSSRVLLVAANAGNSAPIAYRPGAARRSNSDPPR